MINYVFTERTDKDHYAIVLAQYAELTNGPVQHGSLLTYSDDLITIVVYFLR